MVKEMHEPGPQQLETDHATGETTLSVYFKPKGGAWKRSIQIGRMAAGSFVPSGPPRIEDVQPMIGGHK